MKKPYRIKRKKDFESIFQANHSVANRRFVVYHLKRPQAHFRVGLSVSKKLGNAVTRNRIKRRLRHALQALKPHLVTADFVIIARNGVQDLSYQEILNNLTHVLSLATIYEKEDNRENNA